MTDIEIAGKVTPLRIKKIAEKLGISEDNFIPYGHHMAKLPLSLIDKNNVQKSNLILVSAISPTPAGEGKTTTSIGLSEAMNLLGFKTTVVLREPSLGPVFGIKGGATGGGYSQVIPMENINLHFTGDFSAIEKANNLLAALIDNNIQSKTKSLGIDPRTVAWKRVMDMNDRALRNIVIGLGGTGSGIPREDGFNITAASEIMAILCMATDLVDLKKRIGRIFVGYTFDKQPIYARDLNAQGAMTTLLKDAIQPNLVQTMEGNPAIIHGGPFANIAQGTNTIIATKMGLSLSEYVVTEAGFGFDLGGEKFLNIKCQSAGLKPKAIVLVATIRALKYHGGASLKELTIENLKALENGMENLEKHLENAKKYNITPIIAINKFPTDTEAEVKKLYDLAGRYDVEVAVADNWAQGGKGATDLAKKVVDAVQSGKSNFTPLYNWEMPMIQKIETIAKEIYGADGVDFNAVAKRKLRTIANLGLEKLPVCIAKTQKSLSDNAKLLGRPTGFRVTVRDIEIAAGAGFVVPITGNIMRMPGLPAVPAANGMDIDDNGKITGLF